MMTVSGVTNIPVTKLFGRSSAGMNSTGEGEQSNYYDLIKSEQEIKILPQLQKLVDYINVASELKIRVKEPTVEFNSLYQKTDKGQLEEQKIQADIDAIYIQQGVLDPQEVAKSRFGANGFSFETEVE
jgi:phage-related protein (TIGR01555 family)